MGTAEGRERLSVATVAVGSGTSGGDYKRF